MARALGARVVLVVGREADAVRAAVGEAPDLAYAEQKERLGTGHALLQARGACGDGAGTILVLPGDQPLMSEAMLRALVERHHAAGAAATLLTAVLADATGYGRVIRESGRPVAIVEHADATPAQRRFTRSAPASTASTRARLWSALDRVTPQNKQGEYYLTDVIALLAKDGAITDALAAPDPEECLGINDRRQLAHVAAALRRRTLDRLMTEGVTVIDPAATYVDDTVEIGPDTVIYPGAVLEGATHHRRRVRGERRLPRERTASWAIASLLKPYCVLTDSVVEADAQLGPFCHLRPKSHVGPRPGSATSWSSRSRASGGAPRPAISSYIGDATVGDGVNIGAGVIIVQLRRRRQARDEDRRSGLRGQQQQRGGAHHHRRRCLRGRG